MPRPARPISPIIVSLLIIGVWWLIAHNSGSGWVQVLGDTVFGLLATGTIGRGHRPHRPDHGPAMEEPPARPVTLRVEIARTA